MRRHAMMRRLARRSHRSGIHDVVAQIRAVIDAGDHQVRRLHKQVPQRKNHAIGGSPVEDIVIGADFFEIEWSAERQAVTDSASFLVRRNHHDMRKILQSLFQGLQPFGLDPVIIGKKNNFHGKKKYGRDEWI